MSKSYSVKNKFEQLENSTYNIQQMRKLVLKYESTSINKASVSRSMTKKLNFQELNRYIYRHDAIFQRLAVKQMLN